MTDDYDLDALPEGTAEDHAHVWALGDINKALMISNWNGVPLDMEVTANGRAARLPGIVMRLDGYTAEQFGEVVGVTVIFPLDIVKVLGPWFTDQLEKMERKDRARIVANTDPPEERKA